LPEGCQRQLRVQHLANGNVGATLLHTAGWGARPGMGKTPDFLPVDFELNLTLCEIKPSVIC
jgi:hypothetical protein